MVSLLVSSRVWSAAYTECLVHGVWTAVASVSAHAELVVVILEALQLAEVV